jgi:hypothetical protein
MNSLGFNRKSMGGIIDPAPMILENHQKIDLHYLSDKV